MTEPAAIQADNNISNLSGGKSTCPGLTDKWNFEPWHPFQYLSCYGPVRMKRTANVLLRSSMGINYREKETSYLGPLCCSSPHRWRLMHRFRPSKMLMINFGFHVRLLKLKIVELAEFTNHNAEPFWNSIWHV